MTNCECPGIYKQLELPTEDIVQSIIRLKKFTYDHFLYGGHVCSLGISFVSLSMMIIISSVIHWELIAIVYLGTLIVYNYDHYRDQALDEKSNEQRTSFVKKYPRMLPASIIFYTSIFFILLFLFGNTGSIIVGSVLLLLGVLYTDIFKKMTKKIIGLKNVYTSLSLTAVLLLTAVYCSVSLDWWFVLFAVFVFSHFIVDTSFCDLKDITTDQKEGLKTLPVVLGRQKYLMFSHGLNLLNFIVLWTAVAVFHLSPLALVFTAFFVYRFIYIEKARRDKNSIPFLTNVIVDAEYLLWPVALMTGMLFFTIA